MTTAEERQAWRELAEAATPGEWFAYWSNQQIATVQIPSGWLFQSSDKGTMSDAAFIAAARTAVPALLAERDALAAELAKVKAAHTASLANANRWLEDVTGECDALKAELAQYKRNAAYIAGVIESEGKYIP